MTTHLLDSDAVIDALKDQRATLQLLEDCITRGHDLAVNDVVLCEVFAGLRPADEPAAERFLFPLTYLSISDLAARLAGRWRYLYARQGLTLAHTDCLIAACAAEHGATLVTGNLKDFPMAGAGAVTLLPIPREQRRGR